MTRLVVTGGRAYSDTRRAFTVLDEFHARRPVSVLIEGACPTGLDLRARVWAKRARIPVRSFYAAWSDLTAPGARIKTNRDGWQYNANAGPDRNQQMIDEGRPDYGLVFPGGTGTADMRARLVVAEIPFEDVE